MFNQFNPLLRMFQAPVPKLERRRPFDFFEDELPPARDPWDNGDMPPLGIPGPGRELQPHAAEAPFEVPAPWGPEDPKAWLDKFRVVPQGPDVPPGWIAAWEERKLRERNMAEAEAAIDRDRQPGAQQGRGSTRYIVDENRGFMKGAGAPRDMSPGGGFNADGTPMDAARFTVPAHMLQAGDPPGLKVTQEEFARRQAAARPRGDDQVLGIHGELVTNKELTQQVMARASFEEAVRRAQSHMMGINRTIAGGTLDPAIGNARKQMILNNLRNAHPGMAHMPQWGDLEAMRLGGGVPHAVHRPVADPAAPALAGPRVPGGNEPAAPNPNPAPAPGRHLPDVAMGGPVGERDWFNLLAQQRQKDPRFFALRGPGMNVPFGGMQDLQGVRPDTIAAMDEFLDSQNARNAGGLTAGAMNFGRSMQGAMGQMANMNRGNQAASVALKQSAMQLAAERAKAGAAADVGRSSAFGTAFGSLGGAFQELVKRKNLNPVLALLASLLGNGSLGGGANGMFNSTLPAGVNLNFPHYTGATTSMPPPIGGRFA